MVGEINFNMLNTDAPRQVAQAWGLPGAYSKGVDQGLARQGVRQGLVNAGQVNQLNSQKLQTGQMGIDKQLAYNNALSQAGNDPNAIITATNRFDPAAGQKLQKGQLEQKGMKLDQQLKLYDISRQSASVVAAASDANILKVAQEEVIRVAGLTGKNPQEGFDMIGKVYGDGGPEGLRKAASASMQTADQMMERLKVKGQQENVRRGQDKKAETAADKLAAGGGGSDVAPYYRFLNSPEGIVAGNSRTGELTRPTLGDEPVIDSSSSPALKAKLAQAGETGKGIAKTNIQQYERAVKAGPSLVKIDRLIDHLENSETLTGLGADLFKGMEKLKSMLGSTAAERVVTDTELSEAMMGSEVFPLITLLNIGARGMDTPAERIFMQKMLTGEISLTKDTLLEMARIRRTASENEIKRWNARLKKGELDAFFEGSGVTKEALELRSGKGKGKPDFSTMSDDDLVNFYLGGDK